jgi:hypothetical protein
MQHNSASQMVILIIKEKVHLMVKCFVVTDNELLVKMFFMFKQEIMYC